MKICVYGLWHLGSVTAACLSSVGYRVTGLDHDRENIISLNEGKPPLYEPGLVEMIKEEINRGRLSFTTDPTMALRDVNVVWVTFDTPVDDEDNADIEFVAEKIIDIFPYLPDGVAVIISSQVPVGFTHRMEKLFHEEFHDRSVTFVYSPENLRLGKSIEVFRHPGRIVVGIRKDSDKESVISLLEQLCDKIEWMSTESAEMTKHAINSFLATSVAFANEMAVLCEQVGADAKEVERGLKSEGRIGPGAYLSPGAAFAGGTLARDIAFLQTIGRKSNVPMHVFNAVQASNDYHKGWVKHKLKEIFAELKAKRVVVLGLTYKPGTDTLRRSEAVELCKWLVEQGVHVSCYDPVVVNLPEEIAKKITLYESVESAIKNANCLIIATEWPIFKEIFPDTLLNNMSEAVVIDAKGFLIQLVKDSRIRYFSVGRGQFNETNR